MSTGAANVERLSSATEEDARRFVETENSLFTRLTEGTGIHIVFKPGAWWTASITQEVTYDPRSFEANGYTPTQQLFAFSHEIIAHIVEGHKLRRTEEGERLFQERYKPPEKYHFDPIRTWENVFQDTRGNRGLMQMVPIFARQDCIPNLYTNILFPRKDLRADPKHLQFMNAILLGYMLDDTERKKLRVDDEVQELLAGLREGRIPEYVPTPEHGIPPGDIIEALTNETETDALQAARLSRQVFWPIVERLYQQDVKDKKVEHYSHPFSDKYAEQEKRHVGGAQSREEQKQIEKATRGKFSPSVGKRDGGYRDGDTPFEVAWTDTSKYVERLAARLLDTIITPTIVEDISLIRQHRLRRGTVSDVTTLFEGMITGQLDPFVFSKNGIEITDNEVIDEKFVPLDIYLVVDTTGSMTGEPLSFATKVALLLSRSAGERKKVAEKNGIEAPQTNLSVHTFDTARQVVQTLQDASTMKREDFEELYNRINHAGGSNDEPLIFTTLAAQLTSDSENDEISSSNQSRKRVIFIMTDGKTGNIVQAKAKLDEIKAMGDIRIVPLLINSEGSASARQLYGEDSSYCATLSDVLEIVTKVMGEEMTETTEIVREETPKAE